MIFGRTDKTVISRQDVKNGIFFITQEENRENNRNPEAIFRHEIPKCARSLHATSARLVRPFPIYFYNSWRLASACFIAEGIRRRARHSDRPIYIPYRTKILLNNSPSVSGFLTLAAPLDCLPVNASNRGRIP